jgi:hypothetical protein
MSNTDEYETPELDAAILASDRAREAYVMQRLQTRRRMALISFAQLVAGGAAVIIGGLFIPTWAVRIDHMGTFLSLYFSALAAIVAWYWGLGAYERNSMGGMSAGMPNNYTPPQDVGPRPRLTKTKSVVTTATTTAEAAPEVS